MPLDKVVIPEGTILYGRDLGESEIEIETLNATTQIRYDSSSTKEKETITLERDKHTFNWLSSKGKLRQETAPRDFTAVAQATYNEVINGGRNSYNDYNKQWGNAKYDRIVGDLEKILELLNARDKTAQQTISFDPNKVLGLGDGILSANRKSYYADLGGTYIDANSGGEVIETRLSLALQNEGNLAVTISHILNGEPRWESRATLPNNAQAVSDYLEKYSQQEEEIIKSWLGE